jgi:hypothetical protein
MKSLSWLYLFLILTFTLAGCGTAGSKAQPTQVGKLPTTITAFPTMTLISTSIPTPSITLTPFVTVVQHSTPTPTITPLNTLEPEKANEMIKILLQEPVDCSAPCFWGIVPGQTTTGEAVNIFNHLGIQTKTITHQGQDFYNVDYDLDSGLSISVNLPINNNLVEIIVLTLVPDLQKAGITREWSAYSPEALVKRYGTPSRVDFMADWGPGPFFAMQMYFDAMDLIVQYSGDNIIPSQKGSSQVCPLIAPFNGVRLWMGKDPTYPPGRGVPLEKATSMTLDEFSKLMTGEPNHACFIFNGDVFP